MRNVGSNVVLRLACDLSVTRNLAEHFDALSNSILWTRSPGEILHHHVYSV